MLTLVSLLVVTFILFPTSIALPFYAGYIGTTRWRSKRPFLARNKQDIRFVRSLALALWLLLEARDGIADAVVVREYEQLGFSLFLAGIYLLGRWYGNHWRLPGRA